MARLTEDALIPNAKLEGDLGNKMGIELDSSWLSNWSTLEPCFLVQDLRIAHKLFFQNSSQIPLISKGQTQADLHSAMDCPTASAV